MTRLYPATSGPGTSAGDPSPYVIGLSFEVTNPGMVLQGWWWWVASNQGIVGEDFGLYVVNGHLSGTFVGGSKVSIGNGVLIRSQWNFIACNSPIPLTAGQEYRAVKTVDRDLSGDFGYSSTANFWSSGPGGGGITNGPLTAYSSLGEPTGDGQMTFFSVTSGNPAVDNPADYPDAEFNNSNYWLDVEVTTSGVLPPAGSVMFGSSTRSMVVSR